MAFGVVASLLLGCVLPQEDATLEGLVLKNRPPRILEYTVSPNQLRFTKGPNCPIEFSAFVEDPDINDPLRYRWYFDYDPVNPIRRLPVDDGRLDPVGVANRGTAKIKPLPTQGSFPAIDSNTHVVTLLVTDGNLDATQGPGTTPDPDIVEAGVDGGPALTNPRYAVTYSWIVDFDPSFACETK